MKSMSLALFVSAVVSSASSLGAQALHTCPPSAPMYLFCEGILEQAQLGFSHGYMYCQSEVGDGPLVLLDMCMEREGFTLTPAESRFIQCCQHNSVLRQ